MMFPRCALCPNQNACIPADGPCQRGGVLFIGEAPGIDEDKQARRYPPGRPFIGKTGDEVNDHYLPLAGLRRHQVTFANAIRCLPISAKGKLDPNRGADIALLQSCASRGLYPLIERMRPSVLVPLGAFANRAVFGDAFDLELKHGLPTTSPWGIPAFPMFHPALGLHEPKRMLFIRNDWTDFKKFLAGTLHIPVDLHAGREDYAEIEYEDEIEALDPDCTIAMDTESGPDGPYCLTLSDKAGWGRLLRSSRQDLLAALQQRLDGGTGRILFHHWLSDWPVTEAMGLRLPYQRIVDTMAYVWHLGNLRQGLKWLAYRLLGMEMQDFVDLVRPYSEQQVLEYYRAAYSETWPKPETQLVRGEGGHWELYKPQSMNTKLKRFFTDYRKAKEQGSEKDVFAMWTENWVTEQAMIESVMGPWPGLNIRHVEEAGDFQRLLFYACRDSDALIRLWPLLQRMRRLVRRYPQETWRERAA